MLHVTLLLEDNLVVADVNQEGTWNVRISDNLTGREERAVWTHEQFAAAMALAIGGDEMNVSPALYEVAEPLFTNIPNACRIIP